MSYSDATPDSPVPNPPLIQSIEANVPAILAALGLTGLLDAYNAGLLLETEVAGGAPGVRAISQATRWHLSANYRPAAGNVVVLYDVIDWDPDNHLTPTGTGTFSYNVHDSGTYLLINHVTCSNSTINPAGIVANWLLNGATELCNDPQIIEAPPGPTGGSPTQSTCAIDIQEIAAGQQLNAAFGWSSAAPIILGQGFNSYATVARLS